MEEGVGHGGTCTVGQFNVYDIAILHRACIIVLDVEDVVSWDELRAYIDVIVSDETARTTAWGSMH